MLIETSIGRPPFENKKFLLCWDGDSPNKLPQFSSTFSILDENGQTLNQGCRLWIAHKWRIWTGKTMSSC